ncbi:MAG: hypothetical protein ACK4MV_16465 [Beijerinckiaceae bacterium]
MKAIHVEVSADEAAELIGRTPRRIQQMAKEGLLTPAGRGRYVIADVVKAHGIVLQREKEAAIGAGANGRARELRADEIALRLEERSGRLMAAARAEALAVVEEMAGALKAGLMALPARLTSDLALRRRMEDGIDGAFAEVAGLARGEASRLGATGAAPATGPKSPARRVGKTKPRVSSKRGKARAA